MRSGRRQRRSGRNSSSEMKEKLDYISNRYKSLRYVVYCVIDELNELLEVVDKLEAIAKFMSDAITTHERTYLMSLLWKQMEWRLADVERALDDIKGKLYFETKERDRLEQRQTQT